MWESSPGTPLHRNRLFWAGALLFAVTAIAYIPAYRGEFVFDDVTFLVQNNLIRAGNGLARFWFSTDQTDFWPVTYSSFWLEWRLWGMNPAGYHAVNVGLHIAEALLLWSILRRLGVRGAYVAAFLFAVHPVNVESVAWIIQLKNLLAMLFFLLAVFWFVRAAAFGGPIGPSPGLRDEGGRAERVWDTPYLLSLGSFALAMLSKGSVAILPLVLLGLIAWRRRLATRDLVLTLPFFAVAGILAVTDIWFQRHGTNEVFRDAGALERLLGAGAVVWFYLGKALLPLNLVFVYPQWHIRAGDPLWWVPLAAAVAATALLYRGRSGRARPGLFAWGYFCTALVPVMGFTDVYFMKFSLVADHYQHLAIIGVVGFVAFAWAAWDRAEAGKRPHSALRPSAAVAAAAILGLAFLTWEQCHIYRDPETLWTRVLERNPGSVLAQNSLGNVLYSSGRVSAAIARYEQELRVDPGVPDAHNNLGMVFAGQGRLPEATAELETALRLKPNYPDALVNLGTVLQKEGRTLEAIADFGKALRLDPSNAEAHSDMGIALAAAGQPEEAVSEFGKAVRLKPDYADAYCNLGNALSALGRLPDAIGAYGEALRIKPDDVAAHAGLGAALADSGRFQEAVPHDEAAVRLNPGLTETHYNLGNALAQTGRLPEAIAQFGEALRLRPDYAEAHANLGIALFNAGRGPEAAAQLREAARLNPGYAQVHFNLATVLRSLGREDEAKAEFDAADRLNASRPAVPGQQGSP
jgi:tetratricopeptide (TPR) repeat protein